MVRCPASTTKSIHNAVIAQRNHHIRTVGILAAAAAISVAKYAMRHLVKEPMYNDPETGEKKIQQLLRGHPSRFYNMMGMSQHTFKRLVHELHIYSGLVPTRYLSMEEQVAIFVRFCRTGLGTREMQEYFQRSPDTVLK